MVDAARQILDELMGRNRNLDPSQATNEINWEDPEFCQYYNVRFCPHDLFTNTRYDLGPCTRLHDDEARQLYQSAKPSQQKRLCEDEFLRFCNTMLHEVDRKISKGKQRLQLMQRDNPSTGTSQLQVTKCGEQISSIELKIKKLVTEADEAGRRGDVGQARDLMKHCEELKEEKEMLVAQFESNNFEKRSELVHALSAESIFAKETIASDSANEGTEDTLNNVDKKKTWIYDVSAVNEKQMKVCEICGAFLIVGDAQQRIEDHLMGKQHLGYSKLRKAVAEISANRQKERDMERRRREEPTSRGKSYSTREYRDERSRERSHNYSPKRRHFGRQRDGEEPHRHRSRSHKSSSRNHR